MKAALGQMMRQAQQVQENIKRAQDEMARMEVTGESGAGMVRVTLDGRHQARRVDITPAAFTEDREFLEDLIASAINDAAQKLDELTREKMAKVTGGLSLPPGFGL